MPQINLVNKFIAKYMTTVSKKLFVLTLSLAFIMLLTLNGITRSHQTTDLEIIRSNDQGLILRYKLPKFSRNKVIVQNAPFLKFHILNSQLWVSPQKSVLPYRTFWVGIPANCEAKLSIQSFSTQSIDSVLFPIEQTSIPSSQKQPLASSHADRFFPFRLATVSDSGYFRGLRMIQISIFPIQYNALRHRAQIHPTIWLSIRFLKHHRNFADRLVASKDAFSLLGKHLVINWEQAKNWRVPRLKTDRNTLSDSLGMWYKIPIRDEGIYQLTYSNFQAVGLDSAILSEDKLHIFYGGGRELPWSVSQDVPSLREIATYFEDINGDGYFGKNDRLLFYGQSVNGWAFSAENNRFHHFIHHYARKNVYWLALGGSNRKQMASPAPSKQAATIKIYRTAPAYFYKEPEKLNPEKSGIQWTWDHLAGNVTHKYSFSLSGVSDADSCTARIHFIGKSSNHHNVRISINGQFLKSADIPYMRPVTVEQSGAGFLRNGKNILEIQQISQLGRKDEIYLDWMEIRYERRLQADSTALVFYSPPADGKKRFLLAGFSQPETRIYDVTDPFSVRYFSAITQDLSSDSLYFEDDSFQEAPKKYLVITSNQIKSIVSLLPAANPQQELRDPTQAANYLMIAPKNLIQSDLIRLAAHRSDPRFWPDSDTEPIVKIVPIQKIYDAFSWGLEDPTAIRNFLRYAYYHWKVAPAYVLLVGDACYDMKRNSSASPPTLVPTHEDELRATDDWFACVDGDRIPDMIMGRFSVRNAGELRAVVDKVITYDTQLPPGPWQGRILFVADDANSPTYNPEDIAFGRDTETLARDSVISDLSIEKVYLDAYSPDAFGKKEGAKRDFLAQWNKGTIFVNFLGHANLEVLTHESIFYTPQDLPLIQNGRRYPLFFAGTCAVGQFDYDRKPCMAEYLTNVAERGTIATIASTRWTWHALNYGINKSFVNALFAPKNRGRLSIGEALLAAKLTSRYADHRELITLLGDPALRLALPTRNVNLCVSPDTLSLHKRTHVMASLSGGFNKLKAFNGKIFLELRESGQVYHPAGYSYFLPGQIIFQDTLSSADGMAQANFFPKTITLSGGKLGQLYSFAWNRKLRAAGRLDSIPIKKDVIHSFTEIDSTGPEIKVFVNQQKIEDGMEITVFPNFQCQLKLRDSVSGILTTNPERFPVQLIVKGDTTLRKWNLISQLVWEDSARDNATAEFNCRDLPLGEQTFEVEAWDRAYNPAHFEWEAMVIPSKLRLTHVFNFPNPAREKTYFTFDLSGSARVTVKIYTLSGRLIQMFESDAQPGLNKIPEDGWNCRDRDGDLLANGVYLYKILAKSEFSEFQAGAKKQNASALGRLAILR